MWGPSLNADFLTLGQLVLYSLWRARTVLVYFKVLQVWTSTSVFNPCDVRSWHVYPLLIATLSSNLCALVAVAVVAVAVG